MNVDAVTFTSFARREQLDWDKHARVPEAQARFRRRATRHRSRLGSQAQLNTTTLLTPCGALNLVDGPGTRLVGPFKRPRTGRLSEIGDSAV